MDTFKTSRRVQVGIFGMTVLLSTCHSTQSSAAEIAFDLPCAIEFREVNRPDVTAGRPDLKTIEAKLRISARIVDGDASDITDFVYMIKTDETMRIRDYLPKTTLESAVTSDQIEVTAENEKSVSSGLEGAGAVAPLSLGGSHNLSSKKSESSRYKQVAAKDIVLASGTIEREHGVFYRIRPSRTSSLEGGRDFTIVAVVPKSWRGDVCTIACSARATKQSKFSASQVPAGASQAEIGMYLASDAKAAAVAHDFFAAQGHSAALEAKQQGRGNVLQMISLQGASVFGGKETLRRKEELEQANRAVQAADNQLRSMAK
jgi:hypothetical protein